MSRGERIDKHVEVLTREGDEGFDDVLLWAMEISDPDVSDLNGSTHGTNRSTVEKHICREEHIVPGEDRSPGSGGGTLHFPSDKEDGHEKARATNDHSGMGKVVYRNRGWLRKGNPMGRFPWKASLNRYTSKDSKAFAGKTEGYRRQVRRYLTKCELYLDRLGIDTNPRRLGANEIAILYARTPWVSLHERHMMMTRLRPFLAWCGNRVMDDKGLQLDLRPPTPSRRTYSVAELQAMRTLAEGPYERWLLHLEIDYGCRRISVIRARVEDFDLVNGVVILRVKGRGGTRTMEAPMHPDTPALLDAVLQERDGVIARCQAKGFRGVAPPEVLLTKYGGRPKALGGSALDNMLERICMRAGVRPRGHHANRRAAATVVYAETQDLVATQEFLGHADPKTTEAYIGTGLDRQRKAQAALVKVLASKNLNSRELK